MPLTIACVSFEDVCSAVKICRVNLSQPLPPQLVCNQGNHSVVKTTNQFLQCMIMLIFLHWAVWSTFNMFCWQIHRTKKLLYPWCTCTQGTCNQVHTVAWFPMESRRRRIQRQKLSFFFQMAVNYAVGNTHAGKVILVVLFVLVWLLQCYYRTI